jgi:hypothetical protein
MSGLSGGIITSGAVAVVVAAAFVFTLMTRFLGAIFTGVCGSFMDTSKLSNCRIYCIQF